MSRQPLTPQEFEAIKAKHAAEPQCATCMQPQRCERGRLIDTIDFLIQRNGRGRDQAAGREGR